MSARDRFRLAALLAATVAGMTAAICGAWGPALAFVVALAILARAFFVARDPM